MSPRSFASVLGYNGTAIAREPAPEHDERTDSTPLARPPALPSPSASRASGIDSLDGRDRDRAEHGHEHGPEHAMRGGHTDGMPAPDTEEAENGLPGDRSRINASHKPTFETATAPADSKSSRPRKGSLKKLAHSGRQFRHPEPRPGSLLREFAAHGRQLAHSASLDGPTDPGLAETPTALEAPHPDVDSGTDDCGFLIWQPQSKTYDGGRESFVRSACDEIADPIHPEKTPTTISSTAPSSPTTDQSQAQTDAADSIPASSWTGTETRLDKPSPSAPPTNHKPSQAGSQLQGPLHSRTLSRLPPLHTSQSELGTTIQPMPVQVVMAGSSRRRLVTRAKSPLSRSSNSMSMSMAQPTGRGNGDGDLGGKRDGNGDPVTSDAVTVDYGEQDKEEEDRELEGEDEDGGWDYDETEWWGWVVLGVTWFVFVVGMGSCLGVWSWAWDVGTRPWAPPELENDPTLPIVGYYPALIILSCIMAWVWVVVAWVGMKYFRHAQIGGD